MKKSRKRKKIAKNDYFDINSITASNDFVDRRDFSINPSRRSARNDYFDVNSITAQNDFFEQRDPVVSNPTTVSSVPLGMWIVIRAASLRGGDQRMIGPFKSKDRAVQTARSLFRIGEQAYVGRVVKDKVTGRKTAVIKPIRSPIAMFNPGDYFDVQSITSNPYSVVVGGSSGARKRFPKRVYKTKKSAQRRIKQIKKTRDLGVESIHLSKENSGGINLDSMDVSDLKKLYRNFGKLHTPKFNKSAETLFPEKPRGYIHATYEIKRIARLLIKSKMSRLKGKIQDALKYEGEADVLYSNLPEFAKW